jgi:DNA-binding Xre family transcriptional regulator
MVTNVNKRGGERMKKPAFPILAQLMAKHGISRSDISEVIGLSYRNTLKKINGETKFDLVEAGKITKTFRGLGEKITENITYEGGIRETTRPIMIDDIFFS